MRSKERESRNDFKTLSEIPKVDRFKEILEMKITPYTNAIVINGEVHQFKKSKKELTCDECSLRRKVMYAEHCEFKNICNMFRHNWSAYEFGVFKKENK